MVRQVADFSSSALAAAARDRLDLNWPQPPSGHRGDYDLNRDWTARQDRRDLRAAAVLIPVRESRNGEDAGVILTRRTDHLAAHAGQVAFPGGKLEPEDRTPLDAALREAHEEIGLDPDHVRPIGYLDPYITASGYEILPVVATVVAHAPFEPDPSEVAEIFDVPLKFLMSPENHGIGARAWQGGERRFYVMPYDRHYIWGVTAGIIRLMYERLYHPC